MPFHIRDKEADALVRRLAASKGVSLTEAVKIAAANELGRIEGGNKRSLDRIRAIQERVAALPKTGLAADKAFFDDLSGDP